MTRDLTMCKIDLYIFSSSFLFDFDKKNNYKMKLSIESKVLVIVAVFLIIRLSIISFKIFMKDDKIF
jgi:hypothetical protein